jgi:hypothetical protein
MGSVMPRSPNEGACFLNLVVQIEHGFNTE